VAGTEFPAQVLHSQLLKGPEVPQGPAGLTDALHKPDRHKSLRQALQNEHKNNQKLKAQYQKVASFQEISIQTQNQKELHNNSSKELPNARSSKQRS